MVVSNPPLPPPRCVPHTLSHAQPLKYYAQAFVRLLCTGLLRSRLRALLLQGPVDGLEGRPQGRGRHGALGLAAELFLLSIRVGARSAQGQVIEVERVETWTRRRFGSLLK